ncbi:histidine phosphatase family protein [Lysobacter sp. H21R4]|uniref:SixA phosphatase family protein n=1 Tax=Lysobacter sp. H21R4 TaxID=2781021 RepID=UPI001889AACE|nr:histidine phosphatase family protein [Lysobacter sp. H21R4]QOY62816.1 histidine phosphatase family protein [Lysobacter sp. H21R4]
MRELILLRHAHAEHATAGQADIDRPLSAQGVAEAEAAGRWLAERNLAPDRVLCSPARRTRETLEGVLAVIGYVEQRIQEEIYDAEPGALIALADNSAGVERLMLVGHNPGLELLAALLYSGRTGDYRGMPPGSVAVLSIPDGTRLEPGVARLDAFWWP